MLSRDEAWMRSGSRRGARNSTVSVTDLRKDLEHIRASAQAGDLNAVVRAVDHALQSLDGVRLLTTTEAAELLGTGSVNTLKALVTRYGIPYERHGNRIMLPVAEVERLRESLLPRGLLASEVAAQYHRHSRRRMGRARFRGDAGYGGSAP